MLLGKLEAALRFKAAEEEGVLPEGEDRARSMLAGSVAEKELAAEMERGSGGGRPDMAALLLEAVAKKESAQNCALSALGSTSTSKGSEGGS
jgi:hypothetical protein